MIKTLPAIILLVLISLTASAQFKLNFDSLITANMSTFKGGNQFSGKGWEHIIEKSRRTNYVLIGEDHFISEVPQFTQAFAKEVKFDNYICEVDSWMMDIFTSKVSKSSSAQLEAWITPNYNGFAFFQKKNEFELMRSLLNQKTKLIGLEQVGLMSTTILYQYLSESGSDKNKKLYVAMRDSSSARNDKFFADTSKPFFMITPFFQETMAKLDRPSMKADERNLTNAIMRSASIYETGSHRERIKLMQENLMAQYPSTLRGKKSLFKFGANHMIKGESYLPVYDIGTTAHIMAQAENQDSYHVLVLPRSGKQAGFISGSNDIDFTDGLFGALKPFLDKASGSEWTTVDLEVVRAAIRKQKFSISDKLLEKTIFGYDALVVIPVATPAEALR